MASRAPNNLGIPAGTKWFSPYPFAGMNLLAAPTTIDDKEFLWVENFFHYGEGKLRTGWDIGTSLYAAPINLTIIKFFFYVIGTTYYVAAFLNDGSAVQIDMSGNVTGVVPAGTFYVPGGSLPGLSNWGTQYLITGNNNTNNDYWLWDGSLLYTAGTVAPNGVTLVSGGSSYTSVPTVTPQGGSGTGLVVVPTVDGGSVINLDITNPGTGYKVAETVQLIFSGGGSDDSAYLTAQIDAGAVTAVTVLAGGSGYTSPPTVTLTGGGGTGATATALVGSGVTGVALSAGGTGYTSAPVVMLSGGGGSGASATATITGGIVTGVTVDTSGTGYTSAPTVAFAGGGGTGAAATASFQDGVVTGITVDTPGTGYTSAPTVGFSGGGGTGASAQAFLQPGGVTGITVVNAGSGFTSTPLLSIEGGGGAGATATAVLTETSIARINVTSGGTGYQTAPTVGFQVNDGATAPTGVAQLLNGSVVAVNLTNAGSGITGDVYVYFTTGFTGSQSAGTLQVAPGTGATASAVLVPTTIASAIVSSAGKDYTTAPAVIVGSTGNNAASATVTLMPFGVSGAAVNTYQQRVWIADPAPPQYGNVPPGGNFQVSAPGSLTDFATSDGGVQFTNSDGFLQTKYTAIRQSNGYLYMFGDGSVSIISSVNTSGNPATTTFNYQNVDPQAGVLYPDTVQDFGKTILFANEVGIFGIYGGSATLASAKLNDLYETLNTTSLTPSGAVATIFNVKHYLMLASVTDPDLGTPRTVMMTWNEKDWFITSQTASLTFIGTQKKGSKLYAWGTDGKHLYPLFAQPSATLTKRLDTKLYGGGPNSVIVKQLTYHHMQAQDKGSGISATVNVVSSGLAVQADNPAAQSVPNSTLLDPWIHTIDFNAAQPYYPLFGTKAGEPPYGVVFGARLTSKSPDFVITDWRFAYVDIVADIG